MTDLEYLQSLPATQVAKYVKMLSDAEQPFIADRLKRWRAGDFVEEPAALALYCNELRRLGKQKARKEPKPQLTAEQAEQILVDKARASVVDFIEYITGMAPARHHKKWLANIFHPDRKYINIIGPRGSAKTTITTLAMAYIMGKNPLLTNALISVSDTQATERILMLKAIFEYNERFQNVFPDIEIDTNRPINTNEFSIRYKETVMPYKEWRTKLQREGQPKDPSLKVAGMGGSGVIGSRWSGYMLIDDLVDGTMLTPKAQQGAFDYFMNTLMPCRTRTCRVGVVGTRWMVGDFAEKLQKNDQFTTIFIPCEREVDGVRVSYWPEWWPIERLDEEKALIGEKNYKTQYKCDPSATTAGLFEDAWLRNPLPDPLPLLKEIWIITDWAVKVQQRNDFSVFQGVGVDHNDNFYMLDQERVKQGPESSPTSLGNFVDRVASRWGHLAPINNILIESVAFSVTLKTLLQKERPELPCLPVVPKGDKDHRAKLVSAQAERGKIFFNLNMFEYDVLNYEWVNYGTAEHDDTLDPLGLLIQHLGINVIVAKVHMVKFANLY
jgi:phage terminase large subunit-like protein